MLLGHLALMISAMFAGAALYINFAEHPARLGLDNRALLEQWKPSYSRGYTMQATLAIMGTLSAIAAFWASKNWGWLLGGAILFANWPFTFLVIMPTNHRLNAIAPENAGPESRAMLVLWGKLHAVRSALGTLATLVFLLSLQ